MKLTKIDKEAFVAAVMSADRTATGVGNLPAANVIADLMNAGWPKDKK